MQWYAHTPQQDDPVEVEGEDVLLLGAISPADWVEASPLQEKYGTARIHRLLADGLLIGDCDTWLMHRQADERLRRQHWHGLAAIWHTESRWSGLNAARKVANEGLDSAEGVRAWYGPPPSATHRRADSIRSIQLPSAREQPFDTLLNSRTTCRNFDQTRDLPYEQLSTLMARAFGSRALVNAAPDFDIVKRSSPSGGALHPTEAYLIVKQVQGIPAGLYHYDGSQHALHALPWSGSPEDLSSLCLLAVGGQSWFSSAHALVVLAPRFERNFWKYRNHPKAYRVCLLDVGHLSQTLLLSAAEQRLGAFVTAAINEVDIERAFGLTGYVDGPVAVCGVGVRAEIMTTAEFDPLRKVWPRH